MHRAAHHHAQLETYARMESKIVDGLEPQREESSPGRGQHPRLSCAGRCSRLLPSTIPCACASKQIVTPCETHSNTRWHQASAVRPRAQGGVRVRARRLRDMFDARCERGGAGANRCAEGATAARRGVRRLDGPASTLGAADLAVVGLHGLTRRQRPRRPACRAIRCERQGGGGDCRTTAGK